MAKKTPSSNIPVALGIEVGDKNLYVEGSEEFVREQREWFFEEILIRPVNREKPENQDAADSTQ